VLRRLGRFCGTEGRKRDRFVDDPLTGPDEPAAMRYVTIPVEDMATIGEVARMLEAGELSDGSGTGSLKPSSE